MNKNKIQKSKWSIGLFIQSAVNGVTVLLLIIGAVAVFGTSRLSNDLDFLRSEITSVQEGMGQAIDTLKNLTGQVTKLSEAEKAFDKLAVLEQKLSDNQQASVDIDKALQQLAAISNKRKESLATINGATSEIATNLVNITGPLQSLVKSARNIDSESMSSLISFFQLLNGKKEALADAEKSIKVVFRELSSITKILNKVSITDSMRKDLISLKKKLRPLRRNIRKFNKLQESELRTFTGNKIISQGEEIVTLAKNISKEAQLVARKEIVSALNLTNKSKVMIEKEKIAGKKGDAVLEQSLALVKNANAVNRSLADTLTINLKELGGSLSVIPDVSHNISNSIQSMQAKVAGDQVGRLGEVKDKAQQAKNNAETIPKLILTICIIALLLSIGVIFLLRRWIIKPLSNFVSGVQQVTNNDLTTHIKDDGALGELKLLIADVNGLVEGLNHNVKDMAGAGDEIATSANKMMQASLLTRESLEQQEIISEEIAGETESLAEMFQTVADSATVAVNNANSAEQAVELSMQSVNDSVKKISQLSNTMEEAESSMILLKTDSDDIGKILNVIRGVAEQTNLLALNAAIEAARAGDHGRGFAVVADEVRQLAQNTSAATLEIQGLIEKLQTNAEKGAQTMSQGMASVKENVSATQQVYDALATTTSSVDEISKVNKEIESSTHSRISSVVQISDKIREISNHTHKTSATAEENVEASQNLDNTSDQLKKLVSRFNV